MRAFVKDLRARTVTPHIARNELHKEDGTLRRRSAIDGRTSRYKGTDRVGWAFTQNAAAYNLVRLPKLMRAG